MSKQKLKFILCILATLLISASVSYADRYECRETDSGANLVQYGVTTFESDRGRREYRDRCVSSDNLLEVYCDPSGKRPFLYRRAKCKYGCAAGMCLKEAAYGNDSCYLKIDLQESLEANKTNIEIVNFETVIDRLKHLEPNQYDGHPYRLKTFDSSGQLIKEYGLGSGLVATACGSEKPTIELLEKSNLKIHVPLDKRIASIEILTKNNRIKRRIPDSALSCENYCNKSLQSIHPRYRAACSVPKPKSSPTPSVK